MKLIVTSLKECSLLLEVVSSSIFILFYSVKLVNDPFMKDGQLHANVKFMKSLFYGLLRLYLRVTDTSDHGKFGPGISDHIFGHFGPYTRTFQTTHIDTSDHPILILKYVCRFILLINIVLCNILRIA